MVALELTSDQTTNRIDIDRFMHYKSSYDHLLTGKLDSVGIGHLKIFFYSILTWLVARVDFIAMRSLNFGMNNMQRR
jgi:hypothetical protein